MPAINRRDFLRGRRAPRVVFRPPWAVDEADFTARCSRCDACIEACPEHILARGDGGFPELRFDLGGCSFCGDCASACEPRVLLKDGREPWAWRAQLGDNCLAVRGITCRSCGDSCEADAIGFRPLLGGRSEVRIDAAVCNGCGECIHVCPEQAITLSRPEAALQESA